MIPRIFLITFVNFLVVRTGRAPEEIDLSSVAEKVEEAGDQDFEGLNKILAPPNEDEETGGELYELWKDFEKVREDAKKATRDWSQNTYEAMKEAHQMMSKPIHYAKNALMRDAMRVNEAIRGDFKNHVAMIDTISLDSHARNQIRSEYGQHVLIPPDEFAQDLIGRKVKCNTKYRGDFAQWVHAHPLGEIVGFEAGSDAYRVKLNEAQWAATAKKEGKEPPEREFYLLHQGDFTLLPDDGKKNFGILDVSTAAMNEKANSMEERGFYQLHPYVVVDSVPNSPSETPSWAEFGDRKGDWAEALQFSNVCKVVKVDQETGKFTIAHVDTDATTAETPYDERSYKEDDDHTVQLKAGLDFHTFSSVKGNKVKFNVDGYKGTNASLSNVEGRVVAFDPGKGSYTVAVPEFEVPIGNVQRLDRSEKDWHKKGRSGTPSKFDTPRVGKRVLMLGSGSSKIKEWVMGTILGFSKTKENPVSLEDYQYELLSDAGNKQTDAHWPEDWREPAGFTQTYKVSGYTEIEGAGKCLTGDGGEPAPKKLREGVISEEDCRDLCSADIECSGYAVGTLEHAGKCEIYSTPGLKDNEAGEQENYKCYVKALKGMSGTLHHVKIHEDAAQKMQTYMDEQHKGSGIDD